MVKNYDGFEDKKRRKFIESIFSSAQNTYKLLENILTWSRTQTGNIDFTPDVVDIGYFTDSVMPVLKEMADKKEVSLVSMVKKDDLVWVDKDSIELVFRNIISNAIKFSYRKGEVKIYAKRQT